MARMGQALHLITGKVSATTQLKKNGILQGDTKSSFLRKVTKDDASLVSQATANFKRRASPKTGEFSRPSGVVPL